MKMIFFLLLFCTASSCTHAQMSYSVAANSLSAPNPETLVAYKGMFQSEAQLRGVTTLIPTTMYFGDIITSGSRQGRRVAGLCNTRHHYVIIDNLSWKYMDLTTREMVVFHELGHCQLGRGHKEDCIVAGVKCVRKISLMTSYLNADLLPYEAFRAVYLDELFTTQKDRHHD